MKRRILGIVMAMLLGTSLMACGSKADNANSSESKTEASSEASANAKKVGILQYVQHPALDKANEGFVAALNGAGVDVAIEQQNAGGEQSAAQTIANKLVNDKKDLILAIATPAAQAVAGVTSDIPVVITAVTDPAASGLVESNDAPGGNVTGSSDLTPVADQIELLTKLLPKAKNIGILYCTAEANSKLQADMAMEALKEKGLNGVEYTVSSSNEIQTVVESMVGKVDAIYVPTDNVIAAGMTTVAMIATTEHKIPIIGAEAAHVENGALATYGIDYFEVGKLAGEQAVEILNGKSPADIPIAYLPKDRCKLTINEEVASELGIDTSNISMD
ncbi:ABC transporter substrate-binding protein [Lachnoanaerobaculum umeaense]|uniref:ABC transporter substrate-binding protein n=1 Tax=Lachnoanaerobaculum umeaense TaxID=617123 RepID=A0A385PZ60_9FIRM|nr:ABC transporter substrate-binding protein [Lachnoanaerobaculum umeaense]AYA99225.1 ABC transporter substrate-binding protein [Lachnoanaerobaculum umeaense]PZW93180.1 putative ABC transport system substrate-binding protein [Lachnoanaerobaculum umeaense]